MTCDKHIKTPAKGYCLCAGCEIEHLEAQVARLKAATIWIPVGDRLPLPEIAVIAFIAANEFGKTRRIRAAYAPPGTVELDSGCEGGTYDEATDTWYCDEGWYEWNEFEDVHWSVDGVVSHWMMLPDGPPL